MRIKSTLFSFFSGAALGIAGSLLYVSTFAQAAEPRAASVAAPSRFETFGVALPSLGVERTVRVYLPRGYTNCEGCRYPVIYFMDGQNVFDAATSYAGEWGADEVLDDLLQKHDLAVIAVAIDHGNEARMQELSVWENAEFAPAKGDAFLADLINIVKPAIDARYRTRPAAASTTIIGSSMGGLMAHAALLRRPDVFGGAIIFSPSYWFSPAIAEETARTPLNSRQRVFVYAGGKESESMVPDAKAMFERFHASGDGEFQKAFVENPEGEHNEAAWRIALQGALCWRFGPICKPR
jgi:predicted alpha/beta superfamily hydrolase